MALAAAAIMLAGAARATDAATADLDLTVAGSSVIEAAGKPFSIHLHNIGPGTATGIRITIDAAGLDVTKLDFRLPNGDCVPLAPTKVLCALADLPAGGNENGLGTSLSVDSLGGTGEAGSFTVAVESDSTDPNLRNNTVTRRVTVLEGGIDLLADARDIHARVETADPVQPGKTGQFWWNLANVGNTWVQGVSYTITLPDYVTFERKSKPKACQYNSDNNVARCEFPDVVLGPGQGVTDAEAGVPAYTVVKLARNAPGPLAITGGRVTGHGHKQIEAPAPPAEGTEPPVLTPPQDGLAVLSATAAAVTKPQAPKREPDVDPKDNVVPFSVVTAANPADLTISAAPTKGRVGDTVGVKVTVSNKGPADAPGTTVKVTAPAGTEFTEVDKACKAVTAGKTYTCEVGTVPIGKAGSRTLKLKITSATVVDGKAEVAGAVADPKPGNNTTPIKVTVLPAPAPSDSVSPSPSPSASVSPSPPPSASVSASPSRPAAPSGALPVTGGQTALMAGAGLGAVAIGAVLLVLARRRRAVMTPPTD